MTPPEAGRGEVGPLDQSGADVCDLCGKPMEDDNFKDHGEPCWNCPTKLWGADPTDLWPPDPTDTKELDAAEGAYFRAMANELGHALDLTDVHRPAFRVAIAAAVSAYLSAATTTESPGAPRLAEIRARANAATPGPWPEDWVYEAVRHIRRNCDFVGTYSSEPDFTWDDGLDSRFIANAREDVPYLLALLDSRAAAPQGGNERVQKVIEEARKIDWVFSHGDIEMIAHRNDFRGLHRALAALGTTEDQSDGRGES